MANQSKARDTMVAKLQAWAKRFPKLIDISEQDAADYAEAVAELNYPDLCVEYSITKEFMAEFRIY
jgi:hypothetical protein